ncbi:MAG: mechanosensitive ion channel [Candidatus Riflebacteria bacterium]|nr:mechanosensitive ion channel [Candidatus Riflebacteria bacterium]
MDNATKIISSLYNLWDSYFGDLQVTRFGPTFDQTMLATLVFLVAFIILASLFRKLRRKIEKFNDRADFNLKLGELTLVSASELTDFLMLAVRLIRTVVLLFVFLCYVTLVTGFFKATRGFATAGLRWLLSSATDLGRMIISFIPGLAAILFIAFLVVHAIKFLHLIMGAIERGRFSIPGFHKDWASPTDKLFSFLLIALGIVLGAPFLPGFDSPAFQGVSVFLGVLLSLGSTAAVANVVAGVALIYMRACRPGDRVKIGDTEGIVLETGLLVTRIRTVENQVITIPNGLVLSQPVVNLSMLAETEGAGMNIDMTLAYSVDWRVAHRLLLAAAEKTEGIISKPAPFISQRSFEELAVAYRLHAYTRDAANLPRIHSKLRANVLDAFAEAGVEILVPAYEVGRDCAGPVLPGRQTETTSKKETSS